MLMHRFDGFLISLLLLYPAVASSIPLSKQQSLVDGFNVYCTSNRDGTGACFNEETNKSLDCLIIPGQLIDCKTKRGRKYQCVLYNIITASQAEFSCTKETELMLQDEGLDNEGFADSFQPSFD